MQISTIRYSRGVNKYDNTPEQFEAPDFRKFTDNVLSDRSPRKGMAFVCAPLSYGQHDNSVQHPEYAHYRLASHTEPRRVMSLDWDGFKNPAYLAATLDYIQQFSAFAYTTASHTEEAPRARGMIELSRPVTRAEGIQVGMAFQATMLAELGADAIKFDESVYRGEQPCYTPVTTSQTWRFNGKPLDVDRLLKKHKPPENDHWLDNPPAFLLGMAVDNDDLGISGGENSLEHFAEMLRFIDPACNRSIWSRIGFVIADTFGEAGRDLFVNWSAGQLVRGALQ